MAEPISEDRLRTILTETLDDYFQKFGFDTENPIEVQKDQAYIRKVRTGSEVLTSKMIVTILSAAVLAGIGMLSMGFLQWTGGGS